jgi:hypothetical protein
VSPMLMLAVVIGFVALVLGMAFVALPTAKR